MMKRTEQEGTWTGEFGKDYTDRNPHTPEELDSLYKERFGLTRTALNCEFLEDMDRASSFLEVGTNVGTQLRTLQQSGFPKLAGLELQHYALQQAVKASSEEIAYVQGSAFTLPFANEEFDVVFTSGVLIHLSPKDLGRALTEIHRCAKKYIWGFEYFAQEHQSINYRGNEELLWKGNFVKEYLKRFDDLELVKERRLPYLNDSNVDVMFLIKKCCR